MRTVALLSLLILVASCGVGRPDLPNRISPEARAQGYPAIVPLGPLLAQSNALLPRTAVQEGLSLEARAADLRRRAALLRRMQF